MSPMSLLGGIEVLCRSQVDQRPESLSLVPKSVDFTQLLHFDDIVGYVVVFLRDMMI